MKLMAESLRLTTAPVKLKAEGMRLMTAPMKLRATGMRLMTAFIRLVAAGMKLMIAPIQRVAVGTRPSDRSTLATGTGSPDPMPADPLGRVACGPFVVVTQGRAVACRDRVTSTPAHAPCIEWSLDTKERWAPWSD
jgi:hypothetical protein